MTTLLAVVAVVAIAICSPKPDTPAARPLRRMWADLRKAGWKRLAWITPCVVIIGGIAVLVVVLWSTARAGLYGAGVGVAALCCWAASRASLTHRPCRVRLEFCA